LKTLILFLLFSSLSAIAQTTTCPSPTPGSPHVCLKWTDSTTTGAAYNVYRATTSGGENYATPLNATPLVAGSTAYYDATVAVGSTYYYTLVAVGTGGVLSTPTAEVSAQVPVPPNAPSAFSVAID
jgi:fibronectin type 3 domain-containing protein